MLLVAVMGAHLRPASASLATCTMPGIHGKIISRMVRAVPVAQFCAQALLVRIVVSRRVLQNRLWNVASFTPRWRLAAYAVLGAKDAYDYAEYAPRWTALVRARAPLSCCCRCRTFERTLLHAHACVQLMMGSITPTGERLRAAVHRELTAAGGDDMELPLYRVPGPRPPPPPTAESDVGAPAADAGGSGAFESVPVESGDTDKYADTASRGPVDQR